MATNTIKPDHGWVKMSKAAASRADVGIIIGRFQVHELHEEHRALIDRVIQRHDRVIIFVGLSILRNTVSNPLDFNARKVMIQETYPDVEVYYIEDMRSDEEWSKKLDREIHRWLKPTQTATLYGGRDSFIPYYSGKYPTEELESQTLISGTEIRRRISNSFKPSKDYRAGVIAASYSTFPTTYTTVDIAILDSQKKRILVGKKEGEKEYRFIGGFSNPDSTSFENDAKREAREEAGSIEISEPEYLGSFPISDWRYRGERDRIKTLFFKSEYVFGRPEAGDDLASVHWITPSELEQENFVEEHRILVDALRQHLWRDGSWGLTSDEEKKMMGIFDE